jgi:(2R)-3-sulfolactate dehydrogenase (NADP+)
MVESLSAGLSGGALSRAVPDMFNPDDDKKAQGISHTVITINPSSIGKDSKDGLDELAASITASGGRLPGSKRVNPNNLGSGEITLADAVISDLNSWSQKLGLENIS